MKRIADCKRKSSSCHPVVKHRSGATASHSSGGWVIEPMGENVTMTTEDQERMMPLEEAEFWTAVRYTEHEEFAEVDEADIEVQLQVLDENYRLISRKWEENNTSGGVRDGIQRAHRRAKAALLRRKKGLEQNQVQTPAWEWNVQERLPTFSGDFANWAPFRDMFIAEVHDANITKKKKLKTLMNLLTGKAKRYIGEYSVREENNYDIAWAKLCRQYDNKKLTAQAHLQGTLDPGPATGDEGEDLRRLLDVAGVNRRHLQSLLSADKLSDSYFVSLIIEPKLATETRRLWEESRQTDEVPAWEEMEAFLSKRATSLMALKLQKDKENESKFANIVPAPMERWPKNKDMPAGHPKAIPGTPHKPQLKCFYCKEPHQLASCPEFMRKPIGHRLQWVKENRLCERCFNFRHRSQECRFSSCIKCPDAKHHFVLCPKEIKGTQ